MPFAPIHIDAAHPAFAGHFPGRPIVPGVLLLDRAQQIIESARGRALQGLAASKFLSVVVPGEALTLDYEPGDGGVRFTIRCGERVVANGRFVAPGAEAA
jgi:3-hydroxymyristoyl/3-hydroxydecanoyl-(acyl carrier protein) dehydratase